MPFLKSLPAGQESNADFIVPQEARISLYMFLSYKHKIPEDVSWWKAFEMWGFRSDWNLKLCKGTSCEPPATSSRLAARG